MATLLCNTYPYLRIQLEDGSYAQFAGGKLEIEEDDYGYAAVMAEAQRNPSIVVYQNVSTCPHCGEALGSKKAVEAHIKDVHPNEYYAGVDAAAIASREVEIKAREGHACDVCRPLQVFGDEAALQLHIKAFHTQAPELDGDGNELGKGNAASAGAEVPAAKKSSKS